ncbi:hypothetical protein B9Z55_000295 [Caenorhabditis nigoni]|uniref:F-box domain-containing protein n=1 Tax=Caenorhabditis nigoni TaxID=1611254 RepID=A0A2G5VN56_9PELO|nr:hypothetical protein B9Z55_000295 [Caenorhabditis nigoni]
MDQSTPRRYNLRSSHRAVPIPFNSAKSVVPLRKRNSPSEANKGHKRQRTQQSHGPPFKSPAGLDLPRQSHIEQRPIVQLPTRLSRELEQPFGSFGQLPDDVIYQILSRTPYTLLGRMSMTSTAWKRTVSAYVRSGSFKLRLTKDVENTLDSFSNEKLGSDDLYFSMGTLTKYLTINEKWSVRLDCLRMFLTTAYEADASISGIGKMIHAFALRPDDEIVMEEIDDIVTLVFSIVGSLAHALNGVVTRPDVERNLENTENAHIWFYEMELRKTVLTLFLHNGVTDPAVGLNKFFLSSILRKFKEAHGTVPTSLIYLLFSPTTIYEGEEVIHWHRLSQISVVDYDDALELNPLARAMFALLQCKKLNNTLPWTKNTIFNLMEEITTYPNPWSMNTFVALHVLEPELVPIGVVARLNRNHEDEAGDMICTMKMLLFRWKMDVVGVMERALESIKTALKPEQCRTLFDRCWDWHQRNIDDLHRRVGQSAEIRAEIESQMEVMPMLMKLL